MIEELKKESEIWTDYYMNLLDVGLTDSNRRYGNGVKDGAMNTCIPAFMAGAKELFRLLVKKIGYENAPKPESDIFAICEDPECGITYYCVCYVDGKRNLHGSIKNKSDLKYWIDIRDIDELLNGKRNERKDNNKVR